MTFCYAFCDKAFRSVRHFHPDEKYAVALVAQFFPSRILCVRYLALARAWQGCRRTRLDLESSELYVSGLGGTLYVLHTLSLA